MTSHFETFNFDAFAVTVEVPTHWTPRQWKVYEAVNKFIDEDRYPGMCSVLKSIGVESGVAGGKDLEPRDHVYATRGWTKDNVKNRWIPPSP